MLGILQRNVRVRQTRRSGYCERHVYRWTNYRPTKKHGILVCIPKNSDPEGIEDYRPLTLLNSDYKLLTKIMANRMRPWMTDIIQKSQHCGPHGNTIFDAAAAVRDVVAYAEISGTPLCILSIDFK